MALPEDTFREISQITSDLIEVGLCVDQNFPALRDRPGAVREVGFGPTETLSQTLRNVPYSTAYEALKASRAYNVRFIDGGLLHLLYRFAHDELSHHRLAFFPSPDLLEFQNSADATRNSSQVLPNRTSSVTRLQIPVLHSAAAPALPQFAQPTHPYPAVTPETVVNL
jgi:hypothetical protein